MGHFFKDELIVYNVSYEIEGNTIFRTVPFIGTLGDLYSVEIDWKNEPLIRVALRNSTKREDQ